MFDWNDEELTNIIWGEEGETDDHIVPLKERCEVHLDRKELESRTSKPAEQKSTGVKINLHGRKLESSSKYSANEGISSSDFDLEAWPESSICKAAKTDQDPISTDVSDNLAEPTKSSSTDGAKISDLGKDPDIFPSTHESKEQGDFVDYSWANIGSFDDLDRIFSIDVPIFGDGSLNSADELWSSSKDVTSSPLKSFSATLDSSSLGLDIKADNDQRDDQQIPFIREGNDHSSHRLQNVCVSVKDEQYHGQRNHSALEQQIGFDAYRKTTGLKASFAAETFSDAKNIVDKAYRQKKVLKFPKGSEENSEVRTLQDLYGTSPPFRNLPEQFENQLEPSMLLSSATILNQQKKLQVSESSQYPHISNPYMPTSAYGNLEHPYTTLSVLSSVQSPDLKNQLLHSSYEVSPGTGVSIKKSADAPARRLTMTPQEKIEKLRRRQQIQAMLAIQRQQQQFRNLVHAADQIIVQKGLQHNQLQLADGANVLDPTALTSFDPSLSLELDGSNIDPVIDDNTAEYSVLYRLQDVVAKLDTGTRLCIRDSLYRLAQSAVQRHYTSDLSSTNKTSWGEQEVLATEEARKNDRYTGMPDTETETNPIDRTVAHLLFHRPLERSAKHPETHESPASTKPGNEHTVNFPTGTTPESSKSKQTIPEQGSTDECHLAGTQQIEQFKTNIDTSENASNSGGSAGPGGGEVKASK